MKYTKRGLIYGVGVNDADYPVQPRVNGKQVACPFYNKWKAMIGRCYSKNIQNRQPSYKGCTVEPVWHSFMNFKEWVEKHDWEGNQLDKDLLVKGNKVYGPDTCVFVNSQTNTFLEGCDSARGDYPIGVCKHLGKYVSQICINGKQIRLGRYDTPEEAYQAWYKRKRELAIELASQQTDPRVAEAIIARFP